MAGEFGTKMLLKQLQCGFKPVCGPIPAQEGKLEAQKRGTVQLNLCEQGGPLFSMSLGSKENGINSLKAMERI